MILVTLFAFLVSLLASVGLVVAQTPVPIETPPAAEVEESKVQGGTQSESDSASTSPAAVVADDASNQAADSVENHQVNESLPIDEGTQDDASDVVQEAGTSIFTQSVAVDAEASADTRDNGATGLDLGGYLRGDTFIGKFPDANQGQLQAGYGELSLQLHGPRQLYGSAFADARLRYGQQLDRQDLIIDLREAYVDLYAGLLDVRVGKQIIVWGRADAFNPTNNLMPIDMRIRSPIEDDRRVGNVAVRSHLNLDPFRIEGVWIPLYVPTQYPAFVLSEYGDLVTFADPAFPSTGLDDGSVAGRAHLELPDVETSVSYVNGYAPLPGFDLSDFTVGTAANINLRRSAYRQHVVGADFSTAISDLVAVRGEVAYRRPMSYAKRPFAPRPDIQYVLGLDRAFGSLTLLVQYMGRYTFDWQKEGSAASPQQIYNLQRGNALVEAQAEVDIRNALKGTNQMLFSQLAAVQHLATVRGEWRLMHEDLSISALSMVNFTTREWLLFPKIAYQISDQLSTYIGAEIYAGPNGTLFSRISQLSAGFAELRYRF